MAMGNRTEIDLDYFLEWRPYLWKPAVRWLIQDPARFINKRVLDLGCNSGKMSCYFGLLGASVTGIDLPHVDMEPARKEALKWNLRGNVEFLNYKGDPSMLEKQGYDFIFTKSVLVIIPQLSLFLTKLIQALAVGGELISAENNQTIPMVNKAMLVLLKHERRKGRFRGIDRAFLTDVEMVFGNQESKSFWGLVTAIRAIRKS
jgi:2-polyprenyl-3-methyl-5-hydroxy-6-metoxy-1,4-benzoquinol methylase